MELKQRLIQKGFKYIIDINDVKILRRESKKPFGLALAFLEVD